MYFSRILGRNTTKRCFKFDFNYFDKKNEGMQAQIYREMEPTEMNMKNQLDIT